MENGDVLLCALLYILPFSVLSQVTQQEVTEPDYSNMEIQYVADPLDYPSSTTTTQKPIRYDPEVVSMGICEDGTAVIQCPYPNTFVHIIHAKYGRVKTYMCPHPTAKHEDMCSASNSTKYIMNKCAGKTSCEINAFNSLFGDPCVNIYKYMDLLYTCNYKGIQTDSSTHSTVI